MMKDAQMKAVVYEKVGPPDIVLIVRLGFNVLTVWYAWNWV